MARTAAATGSSASATTARACLWGASSASTRTRRATSGIPPSPPTPSGNFVVVWDELWPGRQRLRDLRPALRQRGRGLRAASSASTPTRRRSSRSPSVASDASGNFVVVWQSYGQDGSGYGIFGQRYDSAGVRSGERVPRQLLHDVRPAVSLRRLRRERELRRRLGRATARTAAATASSASATTARACLWGAEFRVNSYTTDVQQYPSVASDASGNFVVVWESA